MAAGRWTFTQAGMADLLSAVLSVQASGWKMALFRSTSNIGPTSTKYENLTGEVPNGLGYTTGGKDLTLVSSGTSTITVDGDDQTWTASGGALTARYAVLYFPGAGPLGSPVLCYCLLDGAPADVTAADGQPLTVQIDAAGIFTLTQA